MRTRPFTVVANPGGGEPYRSLTGQMNCAFSLLELLCVVAIIGVLAALLLPAVNEGKSRAKRIECINQLRQVGGAFHSFAHDHSEQFPMAVPASLGGSAEFAQASYRAGNEFFFSFRHFQVLSNELVTPKLLRCPADTRLPAANFAQFKNVHLSYFVAVTAEYHQPRSILAGDRNLTNEAGSSSLLQLDPNGRLRWTQEQHRFKGNVLFADGHVEQKSGAFALSGPGGSTAVLTLPTAGPTSIGGSGPGSGTRAGVAGSPRTAVSRADAAGSSLSSPAAPGSLEPQATASNPATPDSLDVPPSNVPESAAAPPRTGVSSTSSQRPAGAGAGSGSATQPAEKKLKPEPPQAQPASTAPAGQSAMDDPGFALFPPWVDATLEGLVRKGTWILYLLLLLLVAATLWVRKGARGAKGKVSLRSFFR
jgi:prepilin-type N-terminal cleavage/methylation domain-containing protein/prepilin-type processing-associated H-X9-DG protein